MKSNMTAHLMSAHTKEERIVEISAMNQKDRVQALAVLCRQGMMKRNKQIIATGGKFEDFFSERKSTGPKATCSGCNGVFKNSLNYKHAKV